MPFNFNNHYELKDTHAYLSASKHSWLNYDDDHLREVYENELMKQRGTELHAFAERANKLGLNMPRNNMTINKFINDGLGYGMDSEVVLFYSPNVFGTADLIGYDEKKKLLRIFDLKTGRIEVKKFDQLHIYAALFCLEYRFAPEKLNFEFRLYQNNEIKIDDETDGEYIREIMDKIIHFDEIINHMHTEAKSNRAITY